MFGLFLNLSGVALFLASIAGFFGKHFVVFDLLSQFRVYYAFIGAILLLVSVLWGGARMRAALLLTVLINGSLVLTWLVPFSVSASGTYSPVTVASANVKFNNEDQSALVTFAQSSRPDILFLSELNPEWESTIDELKTLYPYSKVYDPKNNFGIGILSMYPLDNFEIITHEEFNAPALKARARLTDSLSVSLIALHPTPPISSENMRYRDETFDLIAQKIDPREHWIVGGDCNATQWSPALQNFTKSTGLVNASRGTGVIPTWPQGTPNYKNFSKEERSYTDWIPSWLISSSPVTLSIDHLLVNKDIKVYSIEAGPDIKSDHLPIVARLGIPL